MKKIALITLLGVMLTGCMNTFEPETRYKCLAFDGFGMLDLQIIRDKNNTDSVEAITEGESILFHRISNTKDNLYIDDTGGLILNDQGDQATMSIFGNSVINCNSIG